MATPQLAIAKVSFSAVLLRPDPVSCSRADIDDFLGQLDATLLRCSPANVQKSKQWILGHVVQSSKRVAALGKYLAALASSFSVDLAASRKAREPSSKRKRLHILYLLNDVLHHVCVRQREGGFSAQLESFLPPLVQSTAAFANCPKHQKKVIDLLDLWSEQRYFSDAFVSKLRSIARDAPTSQVASNGHGDSDSAPTSGTKLSKDTPYVMPAMHGDANVPWYDLPAANWLPVIEPNSTRPMNPSMIKPLQLVPGPADKILVEAVQNLLADVDRIYAKDSSFGEDPSEDMDMLGQRFVLDESTGNITGGQTYYGWSRDFCQKMKQRRKKTNGLDGDDRGRSLSRSLSRSISRSSSRPAFKKSRVSDSRSRSRSPSRDRGSRRSFSRDRYRRRSFSRSRSSSPRRRRRYSRSRSRSRDYSPPPNPGPPKDYNKPNHNGHQNYPATPSQPPFPVPNFPFGVTPPPPPPNWQSPWPPPPPPQGTGGNWMSGMPMPIPPTGRTSWAAVPPPPPPSISPLNNHQANNLSQHGQHGAQGYYRGGRGGYRGGRGGW
ncbi:hypothetical protein KJ359_001570 [Pestalotiopsis sp. 9143b]|nr:hypothetical protein KJ359_001570 [Pestalotiopsis sp. 9143b]